MLKYINEINCNKISSGDIHAKIIKIAKEEVLVPLTNCINKCISSITFQDELKIADIVPVYKKHDINCKTNHRPTSLLTIISNIFENVFENVNKIFFQKLYGFRNEHSLQNALLNLLKSWQKCVCVLIDLSKTNDSVPNDLFIVKLATYGFSKMTLSVITDYLTIRLQRIKICSTFSSSLTIFRGIPQ